MPAFDPKNDIPNEFYNPKTFFTVGGSAAGVWIFCLVIGAVFPQNAITPLSYRIIAISLSQIIAIIMVLRLKNRKLENWFLCIFNGLLIFINASGWNVITANTFFSDKTPEKKAGITNHSINIRQAGFFESLHQVQWWQNNADFKKNIALASENEELKTQVDQLKNQLNSSKVNIPTTADSTKKVFPNYDSLLLLIKTKDQKIRELTSSEMQIMKQPQPKNTIDTSFSESDRIKLVQSYRALIKNYQIQMNNCNQNNKELISKINILELALSKCTGLQNSN